jgi:hypothetical protein
MPFGPTTNLASLKEAMEVETLFVCHMPRSQLPSHDANCSFVCPKHQSSSHPCRFPGLSLIQPPNLGQSSYYGAFVEPRRFFLF